MKLSVIIPVLNEKRTIGAVLEHVRKVGVEKEIIIVDGGSVDGTREILEEQMHRDDTQVVFEKRDRGRGAALKDGIRRAQGEIVIFQDADLELDPSDYPILLEPFENPEVEVVFGTRFANDRPPMSILNYWGNCFVTWMVNRLFGAKLTDVETCYQVFRREIFEGLNVEGDGFDFTIELTLRLLESGRKIREIPISYMPRGRQEGKKVRWRDGFIALWTILRVRLGA